MTNKEFFISRWQGETKRTLQALKALPTDIGTLNYKPDPKSRTAHEIIGHILPHAESLHSSLDTKVVDEASKHFGSTNEAFEYYESHSQKLIERLKHVNDDQWANDVYTLEVNGHKIFDSKMMDMFWSLLFDTIHHRGQLSTYYRPMGVRNPQLYGPTAEDMEALMAALHEKK